MCLQWYLHHYKTTYLHHAFGEATDWRSDFINNFNFCFGVVGWWPVRLLQLQNSSAVVRATFLGLVWSETVLIAREDSNSLCYHVSFSPPGSWIDEIFCWLLSTNQKHPLVQNGPLGVVDPVFQVFKTLEDTKTSISHMEIINSVVRIEKLSSKFMNPNLQKASFRYLLNFSVSRTSSLSLFFISKDNQESYLCSLDVKDENSSSQFTETEFI